MTYTKLIKAKLQDLKSWLNQKYQRLDLTNWLALIQVLTLNIWCELSLKSLTVVIKLLKSLQNLELRLTFSKLQIYINQIFYKYFKQVGSFLALIFTIASLAQFSFVNVDAASPGPFWTWNGSGTPVKIPDSDAFDKVFVGGMPWEAPIGDFYFAVSSGDVLAWGKNNVGQLGDGTNTDVSTPTTVPALAGVTKVVSAWTSSLGLKNDGSVLFWGNGTINPITVPGLSDITDLDFSPNGGIAMDSTGQVFNVNFDGSTSNLIPEVVNAVNVEQGWITKFALDSSGKVWAWGSNSYGQLGDGTTIDNQTPSIVSGLPQIKSISVGIEHVLALDVNGDVWAWGRNLENEIGQGASQPQTSPLKVIGLPPINEIVGSGFGSKAIDFSQKVWEWGQGRTGGISAIPANLPNPANPSLFMLADPNSLSSNGVTTVAKRDLIVQATLKLTKTASVLEVVQGDSLTYTLNYQNTSNFTATSVVLSDDLDPVFSFASCSDSCIDTAQNITWNLGDLAPGANASVTLTVNVSPTAPVGKVSNTAIISASNSESNSATETIEILAPISPALNLTKTASITQASRNETFDYILSYSNTLATSVDNVIISDTFDSRLTIISLPGACIQSGQDINCNLGTLNSGDSGTLTITVYVNSDAAGGPLANTAIISSDQTDPKSVGNLITINVTQPIDSNGAEVTKTADVSSTNPGNNINYTITVANNNPVQIDNFNITDTLDPRLSYNNDCSDSCNYSTNYVGNSYNSTTLTWSNISIASGSSLTLSYSAQVSSSAPVGELWNTALIDYSQCFSFGCYSGNKAGSVKVDILDSGQGNQNPGSQSVSLSKTASVNQAQAGDTFDYTITATTQNYNGQLYFNDNLDSRLSFVSCNPDPGCSISGQNLSFNTFMSSFSTYTTVVTVVVNGGSASGLLSNTVTVDDLDNTQGSLEPKSATATIQIIAPNTPGIQISKTSSQSIVNQGSSFSYTINYANIGNTSLSNVTISDNLDSRLDFVSCSNSCSQSGQNLTWNLGSLNVGDVGNVTINVQVKTNAAAGILANTAIITSNEASPSSAVNYVRVDQPTSSVGISLLKTANVTTANAGDQIVYALQYANTGNVDLSGAIISDVLDSRLDFVSCSSSCTNTGQNVVWNLGNLAVGANTSVTVTTSVKIGAATGTLTNTGLFETNESAPTSSSVNVTIDANNTYESLNLSKLSSQNDVNRNSTFTYTLNYQNPNSLLVSNTTITDTLDSRLTFVSCSNSCVQAGQDITWNIGSLSANASGSVTVTVRVNNTAAYGFLANIGSIQSTEAPSKTAAAFVSINPINALSAPTLTKTVSTNIAQRGDSLIYTINYSNNSDVNFSNTIITDTLDSRLTFVSCSNSCVQTGQDITWNIGNLNIGSAGSVTLNATVNANASLGLLANTANILTSEASTVSASAYTSVLINEVAPASNLNITKSSSVSAASRGDSYTYSISYVNGPTAITNAEISDTLDSRLTFVSCSNSCVQAGQDITWNLGNLSSNASGTVTVTVLVNNNAQIGGLDNTASIDSTETTITNSNKVTVAITIPDNPTLSMTKTVNSNTVAPGGNLTYTINYSNTANQPVTNVVITDILNPNLSFVSCSDSCTQSGQTITWNLGALAQNASGSVTINVTVSNLATNGFINNTAVITSSETPSTISAVGVGVIKPDQANISLIKTSSISTLKRGDSLIYTITYVNSNVAVTNAIITDNLDSRLTFQTCTGGCTRVGQDLTWSIGSLPANATGSVSVTVLVQNNASLGSLSNTASIDSDQTNPTSAQTNVAIIIDDPTPVLSILASNTPNSINPGQTTTYTINYSNPSTVPVTNTVISTTLNSNLSLQSSCSGICSQSGQSLTWNIGNLAVNATGSISFTVTSSNSAPSGLINTQFDIASTESATNSSSAALAIIPIVTTTNPNFSITKTASSSSFNPGNNVIYTINYSNPSTTNATSIVISDTLDSNLSFVSCSGTCVQSGQNITWTIPGLAVNASGSVTITANIKPNTAINLIENTASITAPGFNPSISTASIAVVSLIKGGTTIVQNQNNKVTGTNLNITKTVDKKIARTGDKVTFTLSYSNDGPETVKNIQITDTLSKHLSFIKCSLNCNTDGQNINWSIPVLQSGEKGQITLEAEVKVLSAVLGVNSNEDDSTSMSQASIDLSENKATIKADGTIQESSTAALAVFNLTAGAKTVSKEPENPGLLVRTGAPQTSAAYILYLVIEISLFGFVYLSLRDDKKRKL